MSKSAAFSHWSLLCVSTLFITASLWSDCQKPCHPLRKDADESSKEIKCKQARPHVCNLSGECRGCLFPHSL